MTMRTSVALFYFIFVISSCAPASVTSTTPVNPSPVINTIPTHFSLGKCIDARSPTPNPNETSLFPRPNHQDHSLGMDSTNVTVIVYSDFQCSSCGQIAPLLKSLVEKYPQDVRVIFRFFPLISIHDKAALAAQAAEAASLQGKFWQMHDFLFAEQKSWVDLSPSDFKNWILNQSTNLQLDAPRFATDLTNSAIVAKIQKAWDDGQKIKLPGTPVILINGEIVKWQINLLDQLEGYVKLAILSKKQYAKCPPLVIDPTKKYFATLKTSAGDVLIRLFVDQSPNTVNNFIFLSQNGWFNNIPFHRVVEGYVVQTGDPSGTGLGGPGYFIPTEFNNLVYDRAGMVGMVNNGPDTNGSQFFITLSPAPNLNKNYPIFGEVISGLDALARFKSREPADANSIAIPEKLIFVSIETK